MSELVDYLYPLEQLTTEGVTADLGPDLSSVVQANHLIRGWVIGANAFTSFLREISDWPVLQTRFAEHSADLKQIGPTPLQDLANSLQNAILATRLMPELASQLEQVLKSGELAGESTPVGLQPYLWRADQGDLGQGHVGQGQPLEIYGLGSEGHHLTRIPVNCIQPLGEQIKGVWSQLFQAKNLLIWGQQQIPLRALRVAVLISSQASRLETRPSTPHPPRHSPAPVSNPSEHHTFTGLAAAAGQALAPALVLPMPGVELADLPSGCILVAPSLQPEWLPLLQRSVGILCKTSGMTSHAAIMARELGLPAVVGLGDDFDQFHAEQWLWLNGDQGTVTLLPQLPPQVAVRSVGGNPAPVTSPTHPEAAPKPLRTQVMVSCSQPQVLFQIQDLPLDGVGLLRSELMLINALQGQHPYLWLTAQRQPQLLERIQANIAAFVAAFQPRPVFYRSLDLRSHECRALMGGSQWEPLETNPVLGLRGTFRYLVYPELFEVELAALAAVLQHQDSPLRLILPFVRSVEEFQFCRQRVEAAGLLAYPNFQLWIMAEVPAILFVLPDLVQAGVQGITIGGNDLTQLLLGVDRESGTLKLDPQLNSQFQGFSPPTYDLRHPAVQVAMTQLIQSARQLGIGCCLCGELPVSDPSWINWLVHQDLPCISVAPEVVLSLRQALENAEYPAH
jgi:phosphoenolpyruvate synthase/pyruvate phosphate dikinase